MLFPLLSDTPSANTLFPKILSVWPARNGRVEMGQLDRARGVIRSTQVQALLARGLLLHVSCLLLKRSNHRKSEGKNRVRKTHFSFSNSGKCREREFFCCFLFLNIWRPRHVTSITPTHFYVCFIIVYNLTLITPIQV